MTTTKKRKRSKLSQNIQSLSDEAFYKEYAKGIVVHQAKLVGTEWHYLKVTIPWDMLRASLKRKDS